MYRYLELTKSWGEFNHNCHIKSLSSLNKFILYKECWHYDDCKTEKPDKPKCLLGCRKLNDNNWNCHGGHGTRYCGCKSYNQQNSFRFVVDIYIISFIS